MLKDITIGQYFPGDSPVHRLDPRMKIILTLVFVVIIFVPDNPVGLLVGGLFAAAGYLIARIPIKMVRKSIKPVIPIMCSPASSTCFLWEATRFSSFGFSKSPTRA